VFVTNILEKTANLILLTINKNGKSNFGPKYIDNFNGFLLM